MRVIPILLATSLPMYSAPAAALQRFDLVCEGSSATTTYSNPFSDPPVSQFQVHYRVDLDAKRWCTGDCTSTSDLAEVTDRMIVFESFRDSNGDVEAFVNRESGNYGHRVRDFSLLRVMTQAGTCSLEPFSGMPSKKF